MIMLKSYDELRNADVRPFCDFREEHRLYV